MPISSIKICVLGQVGSGKSSLTLQYTQSHFPSSFDSTVEDVYERDIKINDKLYRLHILDTANQDDYSPMKDIQLKEADGFIFVYNVASIGSFSGVSDAYRHVMRIKDSLPPSILVANQIDLTQMRQVSSSQGEGIAKEFEIDQYFEVSAKNNFNVTESFTSLAETVIARRAQKTETTISSQPKTSSNRRDQDLRSHTASPAESEVSFQRKAFTLGTSFDHMSQDKDDEDENPSPPVSVIPNRPIDLRALEAKHKRDVKEKKEALKEMRSLHSENKESKNTEEGSSGGCCIIM